MALTIRRAGGPEDVDDLVAVSTALFREDAGTHDAERVNVDWPVEHGAEAFESRVREVDWVGLLATVDGALAGGLMGSVPELTPFDRLRTARLASLWVDPAHRGAGVGGRLVEEFLAWARERGAPYAQVTAFAANPAAVALYERHGFATTSLTLQQRL